HRSFPPGQTPATSARAVAQGLAAPARVGRDFALSALVGLGAIGASCRFGRGHALFRATLPPARPRLRRASVSAARLSSPIVMIARPRMHRPREAGLQRDTSGLVYVEV